MTNTCRGKLSYEFGTRYVFEIKGFSDCGTEIVSSDTQTVYRSRITGKKETVYSLATSEDENVAIEFECSVQN